MGSETPQEAGSDVGSTPSAEAPDRLVEVVRALFNDVSTSSLEHRRHLFAGMLVPLVMERDQLPDGAVKTIVATLFLTLYRYTDRPSRKYVEDALSALAKKHSAQTVKYFVPALAKESAKATSVASLVLLRWSCAVAANAESANTSDQWQLLVSTQASLIAAASSAERPSVAKSAIDRFARCLATSPASLFDAYAAAVVAAEPKVSSLALAAAVCAAARRLPKPAEARRKAFVDSQRKSVADLYGKGALCAKLAIAPSVLAAMEPLVALADRETFVSVILLAAEKGMLRNPETALGALASLVNQLSCDVSPVASKTVKMFTPHLKANGEAARADAVRGIAGIAAHCSDGSVTEQIIRDLLAVLNGSEGKIGTWEHRAAVVSAIGLVSRAQVSPSSLAPAATAAIAGLALFGQSEAHEGVGKAVTVALTSWSTKLVSFPVSLVAPLKEALSKTAKPHFRRGVLDAIEALVRSDDIARSVGSTADLVDALVGVVDRARATQPAQAMHFGELSAAASILLRLAATEQKAETTLSANKAFWAAVVDADAKTRVLLSAKLQASATESDLVALASVAGKLLVNFSSRIDAVPSGASARPLWFGTVVALASHSSRAVRNAGQAAVTALVKSTASLVAMSALTSALRTHVEQVALTQQQQQAQRAKEKKDESAKEADACQVKRHIATAIGGCGLAIATPPTKGDSKYATETVLSLFLVLHHPIVEVQSLSWWTSAVAQMKMDPSSLIGDRIIDLALGADGLGSDEAGRRRSAIAALRTLLRINLESSLRALSPRMTAGIDPSAVAGIGEYECNVAQTAEGTLYDTAVLGDAHRLDASASLANKKRESKVYSYEDELWDAQIRAEMEAKQGKKPELQLTKKQKETMDAQLAKESAIRKRVHAADRTVGRAMMVVTVAAEECAAHDDFHHEGPMDAHAPALVALLIPLLSSALVGGRAVETLASVGSALTHRLRRLAPSVAHLAARLVGAASAKDPAWSEEPLKTMAARIVGRLRALFAEEGHSHALSPGSFAFVFPVLRAVIAAPEMQPVHEAAFATVAAHCHLGSSPFVPRAGVIASLIGLIAANARLQKPAHAALVGLCQSGSESLGPVEGTALIAGISHADVAVRSACVDALHFVPLDDSSDVIVVGVWLACHDGDAPTAERAKAVWAKHGLKLAARHTELLVDKTLSPDETVRIAAGLALAGALKTHPDALGAAVARLVQRYDDKLRVPPPERDSVGNIIHKPFVDPWQARTGVAHALGAMAPLMKSTELSQLFQFLIGGALGDANEDVRVKMLAAGTAAIDAHGAAGVQTVLPVLERYIDSPAPPTQTHDRIRESVVILLGSVARHLQATDPKVPPIFKRLLQALGTPSQPVQEAVARCLPPLIPAVKESAAETVRSLMLKLLDGDSYGVRRGAAYGLAGVVKGLGILALKQFEIMAKLQEAIEDKKVAQHREGALMAFETLCTTLGRLFEPYIIHVLPHLLVCFGDGNKDVRGATEETSKAIMSQLSGHGVKLVLPSLLNALEDKAWRTKQGSAELLGAMAYCAPKQLSSCLPMIVPRLIEVLSDSHAKVQDAGNQALKQIGAVIRNPEIQALVTLLLDALRDPNNRTQKALVALIETAFIHFIDVPSLALIMPILQRALKERSTDTKKMAAQIIGNMSSLTDQKDLAPYLPFLLPGLKEVLLDPIPEVRGVAAKALGTMIRGIGEDAMGDLVPWLLETLRSENSGVDRAGAAQGLSEVLSALGSGKLESMMPDFVANTRTGRPHVREGYLMLFVYMPGVFGDAFLAYIPPIIPSILKGLADEAEYVRDAALKAGQMIISHYADTSVALLLPELEIGLFDDSWRIRQSSVQLLGDLLYKVSGLSGKKTTVGHDDDNFGTEEARQAILMTLGDERRNRVLAGLYMARSDVSPIVRQASLHVWKTVVTNTARTLREILVTLMGLLLGSLASTSYDRRQVAARTLGDLVRKLGERVLPDIIPMLEKGLESAESDRRQGVCVGFSEIMESTSREQIIQYVDKIMPVVRRALCDPLPQVREAAAQTFDRLHRTVGPATIDEIIPDLLGSLADPAVSSFALDGLRQVMAVKSHVVLPFLVPKLISPPITAFNARALAALTSVAGLALNKHLSQIVPALASAIRTAKTTEEHDEILASARQLVLSVDNEQGTRLLLSDLLTLAKDDDAGMRKAACELVHAFCDETKSDLITNVISILESMVRRFSDMDSGVVEAAWRATDAISRRVSKEELSQHIAQIRRMVHYAVEDAIAAGLPGTELPGFNIPKGVAPMLPGLLHGLTNGTQETRESAAKGLGEIIRLTRPEALKPFVIQITGPLIRVIGDKWSDAVKSAILETLTLLLERVGPMVKPFVPQLQTSFVKSLNDGSKDVRAKAAAALGLLITLQARVDPLITELASSSKTTTGAVQETMLRALANVLLRAGKDASEATRATVTQAVLSVLGDNDESVRVAAAACLGTLSLFAPDAEIAALIKQTLLPEPPTALPERHGRALALSALALESPQKLIALGGPSEVAARASSFAVDERVPIAHAGVQACGRLVKFGLLNAGTLDAPAIEVMVRSIATACAEGSTDTRFDALRAIKSIAKSTTSALFCAKYGGIVLPVAVSYVRDKNTKVKLAAGRTLAHVLKVADGPSLVQNCTKLVGADTASKIQEYYTKVLSYRVNDESDNDDLLGVDGGDSVGEIAE